jgi:hypothetical protein
MEHWNYRVLARKISFETSTEIQYGMYEVHYKNDIPIACTEFPVYPLSFNSDEDPIESLKWQLDAMKLALEKPILNYDDFPNEYLTYSRRMKLKMIK